MTADQRRVCAFIDDHPSLSSALYDLGLSTEETIGSEEWPLTVRVVALYAQAAGMEPPWPAAEEESPAAQARRRARETGEDPPCSCLVPPQVESRARERRMACGCAPRFSLIEACAAEAERIECEALGSPIAQDTARRIRLAILALGKKPR